MKITLIHTLSPTTRELFEFDLDYSIRYVAYFISHRDDENDIWGDEWQEYHKKEKGEAWQIINDKLDNEGYNDWDDEIYGLKENLRNKYWPTCCKTIRGETRLSGQSGGKMPAYPWSERALKQILIGEVEKKIMDSKIYS
jgi:hypothetical protein